MGLSEVREALTDCNVGDLLKAQDLINEKIADAKTDGFYKALRSSEKVVYINKSKGKGEEWHKALITGVLAEGIRCKDWNEKDAKNKSVKWDSARTIDEHQKLSGGE